MIYHIESFYALKFWWSWGDTHEMRQTLMKKGAHPNAIQWMHMSGVKSRRIFNSMCKFLQKKHKLLTKELCANCTRSGEKRDLRTHLKKLMKFLDTFNKEHGIGYEHDIEVMKCSKCIDTFYCNRHCQKQHWKIHRYECKSYTCVEID